MAKYEKAHAMYVRLQGADGPKIAMVLGNMASVIEKQGKSKEALPMREQALDIKRRTIGIENDQGVVSLYNLGVVHFDLGMYQEALSRFEEGLGIVRRIHPERNVLE
eukprot:CAMPEP_0174950110 /NCGR_PEP_ID=MMETSP1355-20121228/93234_1 /TAXON_ID=464990 /ORGANISM="Hemiselmis tepida, Strain CCMP443" /LENGTH=106 /DNA_ID=CAMNT_0016197703 /DNA_START=1 /DNA_END=318 /DNA_ORIENTATION=-